MLIILTTTEITIIIITFMYISLSILKNVTPFVCSSTRHITFPAPSAMQLPAIADIPRITTFSRKVIIIVCALVAPKIICPLSAPRHF